MTVINRKMLSSQLLSHIIALLVIVVWTILFIPRNIDGSFTATWIVTQSIIMYLRFLIPIVVTGFTICFSVLVRHKGAITLQKVSFLNIIKGTLIFLFVIVLIYILLIFFLWPWAYHQRAELEDRSEFIDNRIEQGIKYLEQQEYLLASREIEQVLNIVPLHREGVRLFQEIQALTPETPVLLEPEEVPPVLPLGLEYSEISALAEQYFNEGDFFSALFYARRALGSSEEQDNPAVRRILTASLKEISGLNLSEHDQNERELFYLKRSAAQAYNSGEYLNAYYIFKDIQSRYPLDSDAQTYLADIQPRIQNISFFVDEIEEFNRGEVRRNIFLRMPVVSETVGSTPTLEQHFLAAEQMIRGKIGLYFINLEYLTVNQTGRVIFHVKIPRAKLSGTYLITRAIDREKEGVIFSPEYFQGRNDQIAEILEIASPEDELWAMNSVSAHPDDINIAQLFSLVKLYPTYGRNPAFPQAEILYRFLFPFSLIIGSLFAIAFAWRGRSRYINGPPWYTLIFFPLIPLFLFSLFELYLYTFRVLFTSILLLTNFTVTLVIFVGVQALLLTIGLFVLAGQDSD